MKDKQKREEVFQEYITPTPHDVNKFMDSYEQHKKKAFDGYLKGYVKYDTSKHDDDHTYYCDGFNYNPQKPNDINYH
ncbi:hypothetical protein V6R21_23875 [Limibacter armeniacum]|uniref:hypothetical protein n=1 Tax=Limibacter armeniacum TaxID=466084 RepID=UPI002FE590FE